MAKIKVTQKRNDSTEICISGELNIYSAMDVYQQHFQSIKLKSLVTLKLSGVTEIDTAGMQILLVLIKEIKTQGLSYHVASLNNTIKEYSELFNVHHYFTTQEDSLEGAQ